MMKIRMGKYATKKSAVHIKVMGVRFTFCDIGTAVRSVLKRCGSLKGRYICFTNVHTTVEAQKDPEYRDILNGAAFTFPDGMPVAFAARIKSLRTGKAYRPKRVAGPDFMRLAFENSRDGKIKHFFYGSTEETLTALTGKLEKEYPGINICGKYSPPFRELTAEEDSDIIKMINASGADLVWVGLGAPKQEKWMSEHAGKINALMLGVGAGFDFHAGTVKRAPLWMQKTGLEWCYRLMQDPKRLFSRYLKTNSKFIMLMLQGRY